MLGTLIYGWQESNTFYNSATFPASFHTHLAEQIDSSQQTEAFANGTDLSFLTVFDWTTMRGWFVQPGWVRIDRIDLWSEKFRTRILKAGRAKRWTVGRNCEIESFFQKIYCWFWLNPFFVECSWRRAEATMPALHCVLEWSEWAFPTGCYFNRSSEVGVQWGGNAFPHLFALHYIETWLQSHRCASDTQIRTASQTSM